MTVREEYWGLPLRNKPDKFCDIYEKKMLTEMCGDKEKAVRLRIRERLPSDPESTYWGWLDTDSTRYSMIFHAKVLFEICFPYGYEIEEVKGKGRGVNLIVEPWPE